MRDSTECLACGREKAPPLGGARPEFEVVRDSTECLAGVREKSPPWGGAARGVQKRRACLCVPDTAARAAACQGEIHRYFLRVSAEHIVLGH